MGVDSHFTEGGTETQRGDMTSQHEAADVGFELRQSASGVLLPSLGGERRAASLFPQVASAFTGLGIVNLCVGRCYLDAAVL